MRNKTLWYMVLAMGLALCGCQSQDENPNWDPETNFPDWTYDKPVYTEPAVEPQPYETVANGIDVYYSRSDLFFIHYPGEKQPDVRPRTALWYSFDEGNSWQKNGYFGLDQKFYSFFAEHDGRYWIRFVGPNMGAAEVPPGQPHEIHVVDTQVPVISMEVTPPPVEEIHYDCEGNEVECHKKCCCHRKVKRKHMYHVGEKVLVSWNITDANLEPRSIELSTCFARFPHNLVWSRFKGKLSPAGTLEVVIPAEAASQAGMRFRIIAHDKADNIGLGMSEVMDVEPAIAVKPQTARKETSIEPVQEEKTLEAVKPAAKPEDTEPMDVEPDAEPVDVEPMETPPPTPAKKQDIPEPDVIEKPKPQPAATDLPEPPTDLTEPVNIESPATKPAVKPRKAEPKKTSASTKPIPILSLSDTLPATKKTEPVAATPKPVKKEAPVAVAPKPLPKPAEKRSSTSLADMEREMEKARKAKEESTPAPKKPVTAKEEKKSDLLAVHKPEAAKTSEPVAVKVLTKAPEKTKTQPEWKPIAPSEKIEKKPSAMKLSDIPEKTQQGWPAKGMTLQGGVSRLLNWLPKSAANYKTVALEFTSNGGKTWVTVAKNLRPGSVATWTVPMVTSKTCLLRVVGKDAQGKTKSLETSETFQVDAGKWETIDMSGFKMQVPKSK